MSNSFDFDLFVIGGGSGGVRAARLAAQAGAKTALAEKHRLGGTCVNLGCIPKKLMIYGSSFRDAFDDSKGYGWSFKEEPTLDWKKFMAAKNKELARLNAVYETNLKKSGVHIFEGLASFEKAHHIRIGEKVFSANHILIATGGTPFEQDIPGKEYLINSDDIFSLEALPKDLVILGSGYVAIEFAGIFAALGVKTTLCYRGKIILKSFDRETAGHLCDAMVKNGITLSPNTTFTKVEKTAEGRLKAFGKDGKTVEAALIFQALGRSACTKKLELENIGLTANASGFIDTDAQFRTQADQVFAIGDVTGGLTLTPRAIADAMLFVQQQFGKNKTLYREKTSQPTAIFSSPYMATVGPSEEELRDQGITPLIYKSHFRPLKATISGREDYRFIKILVHPETDQLLACHMLGEEAPDIIQALAVAIGAGLTKKHLDDTLAIHPTTAEEIVTFYEASE